MILDLRIAGEGVRGRELAVRKLGMKYVNVPLSSWSAPTQLNSNTFSRFLFHSDTEPVFVHCRRGKDRTGTVIACYRIQHDSWTNRRALRRSKWLRDQPFGTTACDPNSAFHARILPFTPDLSRLTGGNRFPYHGPSWSYDRRLPDLRPASGFLTKSRAPKTLGGAALLAWPIGNRFGLATFIIVGLPRRVYQHRIRPRRD